MAWSVMPYGVFAVQVSEMDAKHLVVHGQHFPSYQLSSSPL
jgi:hypothetical protein